MIPAALHVPGRAPSSLLRTASRISQPCPIKVVLVARLPSSRSDKIGRPSWTPGRLMLMPGPLGRMVIYRKPLPITTFRPAPDDELLSVTKTNTTVHDRIREPAPGCWCGARMLCQHSLMLGSAVHGVVRRSYGQRRISVSSRRWSKATAQGAEQPPRPAPAAQAPRCQQRTTTAARGGSE